MEKSAIFLASIFYPYVLGFQRGLQKFINSYCNRRFLLREWKEKYLAFSLLHICFLLNCGRTGKGKKPQIWHIMCACHVAELWYIYLHIYIYDYIKCLWWFAGKEQTYQRSKKKRRFRWWWRRITLLMACLSCGLE